MASNRPNCDLVLRRAGPDDAPAISTLVSEAYSHWIPTLGRTPIPMLADYTRAIHEHQFDLLEADGRLVALLETALREEDLLIVNIAVHPDAQGAGLGRHLMDHAEHLAITAGQPKVRLYTASKMTSNLAFYQRHGYTIEREEPYKSDSLIHFVKTVVKEI